MITMKSMIDSRDFVHISRETVRVKLLYLPCLSVAVKLKFRITVFDFFLFQPPIPLPCAFSRPFRPWLDNSKCFIAIYQIKYKLLI